MNRWNRNVTYIGFPGSCDVHDDDIKLLLVALLSKLSLTQLELKSWYDYVIFLSSFLVNMGYCSPVGTASCLRRCCSD